jgi:hypothetical protein
MYRHHRSRSSLPEEPESRADAWLATLPVDDPDRDSRRTVVFVVSDWEYG